MNPKVTISGAGLVGSLISIYLARRGFEVEIFERRPDMRRETISAGRSINLAISVRGIHALRQVGLAEVVLSKGIPMRGRMIHPIEGELNLQPYGKNDSECIYSISRGELNKILMSEAEKTRRVQIQFNQNFNLENKSDSILIGADGAFSAVREGFAKSGGFEQSISTLAHGYKELQIPSGPGGSFRMEKNALHIWPRGNCMLIGLPNFDGSFTCTLFLPFEGPLSFAALDTPTRVKQFFVERFPDALPLLPHLEQEFFENPTGQMVTVKCAPWTNGSNAILLGDAAHAIVPFFGQGMNCGFEDCFVFDRLVEKFSGWRKVFHEFYNLRKTNADAIADMAVENFIEMRDKVADPKFIFEKKIERILQRDFPELYISRYSLVSFSRVPYRLAYEAGQIQSEILAALTQEVREPEDIDFKLAGHLIQEKLAPLMRKARGL